MQARRSRVRVALSSMSIVLLVGAALAACSSSTSNGNGGSSGGSGSGSSGSGGGSSGSASSGGSGGSSSGGVTTSQTVGATGGTVTASDGTSVVIPAGALPGDVVITIALNGQAPPLTVAQSVAPAHVFGPEGQQFAKPIQVTLAFDPANLPQGATAADLVVYTAPQGSSNYQPLPTTVADASHVTGTTTHFSNMCPGWTPPTSVDGGGGSCAPGVPCAPNSGCGSTSGITCTCVSGAYQCTTGGVPDGGGGPDASGGTCAQGAPCNPGSGCGGGGPGGSISCSCVSGAYQCTSGTDAGTGGAPDASGGTCAQGAPCNPGAGCGGTGPGGSFSCSCVNGAYQCTDA